MAGEAHGPIRAFRLVVSALLCIPCISIPGEVRGRQLPEDDKIRLAAFEHLATMLFPADTAAPAPHCFALRDEADFAAPPEGPGRDPGALLMSSIRHFLPDASTVSECPEPDPDPNDAAAGGSNVSPVIYSVGALTQVGSTIKVPVSYRVSGLNGGGWACWAGLQSDGWRVVDCLPTWISAPD